MFGSKQQISPPLPMSCNGIIEQEECYGKGHTHWTRTHMDCSYFAFLTALGVVVEAQGDGHWWLILHFYERVERTVSSLPLCS